MMVDGARLKALADHLHIRPSYVVLGERDGHLVGIIERSFSMDLSDERVRIWWSSENAVSNFGIHHVVNGEKDAEYHRECFDQNHSEVGFQVFDLNAPDCPIDIDWAGYLEASAPDSQKLSGVKDKFGARNPKFHLRSSSAGQSTN